MTHDELRGLTGGYAFGSLSEPERRELEAHLPTCPACADEVRSFVGVTNGLALAVLQQEPTAALRARVLRAAVARPEPHRGAGIRLRVGSSLPTWLAIAASLAAVALGLYALALRERLGALQDRLREANERALGFEQQVAVARSTADLAEQRAAIHAAADVRQINLAGKEQAPDARGRAFWSPSRGLVFMAANLPQPPPGRQYQLWVIPPGGTPISAGLLELDADGRATRLGEAPTTVQIGAVAVSLEATGGAPSPTGPIVLVGALTPEH